MLLPLVNEGFKCLEEGIAQRESDIDMVRIGGMSLLTIDINLDRDEDIDRQISNGQMYI